MSKKISFYAALGIQGNPAAGFIHSQLVDRVLDGQTGGVKVSELAEVIFEDPGIARDAIEFLCAEGLVTGLSEDLVDGDSVRATRLCVVLAKDQKGLDFEGEKPPIHRDEAEIDGRFYEMQAHKQTPDGHVWFGNCYELDAIGGERIKSVLRGAQFDTRDDLWAWWSRFQQYLGHQKPCHAWASTLPFDRELGIGDDPVQVMYVDPEANSWLLSEQVGALMEGDAPDTVADGTRLYVSVEIGGYQLPSEIEEWKNRPPIEDDDLGAGDEGSPAEDVPRAVEVLEGEFEIQ